MIQSLCYRYFINLNVLTILKIFKLGRVNSFIKSVVVNKLFVTRITGKV